ncbi:flagellar hook-associated protein FlaN [Maricaulis sp. W15]|uniref:Flagellar hook-associated protein 1 n=1 Tax=Maricaulis maris TaxID=74318 RepID=A0A495DMA1_9PROT|nr:MULTISPECIES: flagellar hook-associated protein FlgK [Maricaulis]OLF78218.1 flagellar hook-associated protein FlaN [Maricaulis sp. W15]RKR04063.1 flagellar hook-associated protein 1 FlgK [Maricaulis maris]
MSLSGILGNALSGLQASQAGLRASSNNVANVNTPGYARTIASFEARNVGGVAMGVQVNGIVRIVDRHLQLTSLRSISEASVTATQANALDRLQSQFGNLDDSGSIFARLNSAFAGLSQASVDPTLSVSRLSATADLDSFFTESERLSGEIRAQRMEADAKINATLQRSNEILRELYELNANVQSVSAGGGDSSGAENRVSELLDELSEYMDVRADFQGDGRVVLRTTDGVLLLDNYPANLTYKVSGSGSYGVEYGKIYAESPNGGNPQELDSHIQSGELRALIDLRDRTLPDVAEELAEMAAGAADALNAAHNDAAAYPAPQTLTGRNTGLDAADAHNFTGATTLAVADNTGQLVRRVDVDFDAGTYSVDGGGAVAFGATVGDLATALNTALAGVGTASFTNGTLSVAADSANNGVAFLQDETTPSDRGGRGLSHFFGLNDLVRSDVPGFFETGLSGTDLHQFSTGTSLNFRMDTTDGKTAGSYTIPMVTGETVDDIVTALNDPATGMGRYVTFSLDGNGKLSYTANAGYEGYELSLTGDDTARGTSGVAFSKLFGVGLEAKAARAEAFSVDKAIRADSSRLALGKLDIDAATVVGDYVLAAGDNRGGAGLQAALSAPRTFNAAGSLSTSTASLGDYTARIAGTIGSRAARAESEAASAATLQATAAQKRSDVEGVSLDEELAAMTLYQQSYNAAARMLQAAKEMTDTLMGIV